MDVGATQFVGSQSQQQILLQQPPFDIIGQQVFRRQGRGQEIHYLIRFIGEADGMEVLCSRRQLLDAQGGREALAAFEADVAPRDAGGLQDTGANMGFEIVRADSMPVPEPPARQMPLTQQPSEAQLPQTQQQSSSSPTFGMPSQPHWEESMPSGTSGRMQQPQEPYNTASQSPAGAPPIFTGNQQGGSIIVNGLPSSYWENPSAHKKRRQVQHSPPGVPAAWTNAPTQLATQPCMLPHPSPRQQGPSPQPQGPQHSQRPPPVHSQPQTTFESLAARTYGWQEPYVSGHAPQEQWHPEHDMRGLTASRAFLHRASMTSARVPQAQQSSASPHLHPQPQNVFASLAAHSRGHQEAPTSAHAPEEERRPIPAHAQQQPRNIFESLAARSRHLDERRQLSSTAPGQFVPGQRGLASDHSGGSRTAVHGVTLRHNVPQHQQSEWMGQPVPADDPHGAQGAGEASYDVAPAGVPLPQREAVPAQLSPNNRAYFMHRAPAQQAQPQVARPVPASFQPAPRTWQAQANQHAVRSEPVLQQQAGTVRQPGQNVGASSSLHADAPHFVGAHVTQAPESPAADQAGAQPQEPAQAGPRGFYNTWLQNLSTSMHVQAPAWSGGLAPRSPSTAQAPSMAQDLHQFGQGRTTQTGANAPSVQSIPAKVHPAPSRAPAPTCVPQSAHPSGQAQEPRQGIEHQEPMHSSADTEDVAVALAALEQEAARRIRGQARQESVPPAEAQGAQLPYVSAPAWGAWVPAIQQMVHRGRPKKPGEANGPAAQELEDLVEGSPAPLQQRPDAAVQETGSPPKEGRACQRKQLKPVYINKRLDEVNAGPTEKLKRLIKKAAEAMIVEAAARADDSETGSSAERFIEQTFCRQTGNEEPVNDPVHHAEPADLTRASTPIPDSAAEEAETPDHAEGGDLARRLGEQGWEGAIIKRAKRQLGDNGEDELEVQILWPDDFSTWVDRTELHIRPHTHLTLIRFYESKTRAK